MDSIRASGYLETRWAQDKDNSITAANGAAVENGDDGDNTADDDTEEEGETETIAPEKDEEETQQEPEASIKTMAFTQRLRLKTLELPQGWPLLSLLLLRPHRMSSMIPSLPPSQLPSLRFPRHL